MVTECSVDSLYPGKGEQCWKEFLKEGKKALAPLSPQRSGALDARERQGVLGTPG